MKKVSQRLHSIAFVGKMNPAIFHPIWFSQEGIIGKREGEAKLEVNHPDVSIFNLNWIGIRVFREKFAALTLKEGYKEELYDLVMNTFNLLQYTPISALGINSKMQIQFNTVEECEVFFNKFFPVDIWSKSLENPKMSSISIKSKPYNERDGHIIVRVDRPLDNPFIVQFDVNDHYNFNDSTKAHDVLGILNANYEKSIIFSDNIINSFMEESDE